MTELSLTDDQLERLREIADELEDAYVGPYGSIRTEDAVDYLIDTYTPPEDADAEAEPAVDAADGDSGDADSDAGNAGSDAENAGDDAENAAGDGSEGDAAGEGTEGDDAADDTEGEADGGDDTEVEADDGDGTEMPTDATSDGGAARLQSMMSMLDDFDDKWRKAQSGEEPYEVDLPEGGTESARTKDDVRRVLFQHYR